MQKIAFALALALIILFEEYFHHTWLLMPLRFITSILPFSSFWMGLILIAAVLLFTNITCSYAGQVTLQHNLGRPAQWFVARWVGAPAWTANKLTALNTFARAITSTVPGAPSFFWKCTTKGTTGNAEPTWDITPGNTTADGTVTWTNIGVARPPSEDYGDNSTIRLTFFEPGAASIGVF